MKTQKTKNQKPLTFLKTVIRTENLELRDYRLADRLNGILKTKNQTTKNHSLKTKDSQPKTHPLKTT
jgi:hypothetical protein